MRLSPLNKKGDNRMIGIYKITNLVDGNAYIGQSIQIEERFKEHKNPSNWNREVNKKLYELYNNEIPYKKYIKILKSNQVCVSEITLLDKLLDQNKITKEEYKDNALNASIFIEKLLEFNKQYNLCCNFDLRPPNVPFFILVNIAFSLASSV